MCIGLALGACGTGSSFCKVYSLLCQSCRLGALFGGQSIVKVDTLENYQENHGTRTYY